MAGLNVTIRNAELDHFGSLAVAGSLYAADPGNGLSPSTAEVGLARQTLPWSAAAAAAKSTSGAVVFDVPAATTVAFLGYWAALTAGVYYGSRALSASETFIAAGTYTIAAGGLTETLNG